MPDPKVLVDAGGWAVVVAMLIAIGLGVIKGWWVPGFVYRREVSRADTMTGQLERNTQSMRELTIAVTGRQLPPLPHPTVAPGAEANAGPG